ncbi:uncharacterized protein LOC108092272 [Drosophila ficusphila]|uniref:uncharacterized protein LOC108092272 n=1 Tax=Drosophila ficusphila TaxID=30025 RepID=UPI0007E8B220|nr:uncharacterized protein LOC108092272 [Drosophila ficusphila]
MANTNWCKWSVRDYRNEPPMRAKLIPGFDRLDDRLRAVLREQDAQRDFLKRKQAGGGQKKGRPKKLKRAKDQAPRVCEFQKVYTDKRKELKRLAKNERMQHQFRSSPMPDFQRSHQRLERRRVQLNSLQKVTKPRCPGTLATSMEALHRREKEQKQRKKLNNFSPRINPASSMDYLHRLPFVPQIESSYTRPKPFHLLTSERALYRRLYDERKRTRMDQQMRQKYFDWFKRERTEFLKLRRMTNFKATPILWRRKGSAP